MRTIRTLFALVILLAPFCDIKAQILRPILFGKTTGAVAPNLINNVTAQSVLGAAFNSSAIDSTGGNIVVISVGWYNSVSSTVTVLDYVSGASCGTLGSVSCNSWTCGTIQTQPTNSNQLCYVVNATVGTGHQFSISTAANYASICVGVFSGGTHSPSTVTNGAVASGSVTTISTGTISPPSNALIVSGVSLEGNNQTMTSTLLMSVNSVGAQPSNNEGCGLSWALGTGSAKQETWTMVSASSVTSTILGIY